MCPPTSNDTEETNTQPADEAVESESMMSGLINVMTDSKSNKHLEIVSVEGESEL